MNRNWTTNYGADAADDAPLNPRKRLEDASQPQTVKVLREFQLDGKTYVPGQVVRLQQHHALDLWSRGMVEEQLPEGFK